MTVMSTVPEMDALPTRALVMDGTGEVWRKLATGRWDCLDASDEAPSEDASTVIWQTSPPAAEVLWVPDSE